MDVEMADDNQTKSSLKPFGGISKKSQRVFKVGRRRRHGKGKGSKVKRRHIQGPDMVYILFYFWRPLSLILSNCLCGLYPINLFSELAHFQGSNYSYHHFLMLVCKTSVLQCLPFVW